MSKRLIVEVIVFILVVAISGCGNNDGHGSDLTSVNWSGYQIVGAPLGFNSAAATWDVPEVGGRDGLSATWVGIGGGAVAGDFLVDEPTLIQAGTEQDVIAGKPTYSAWWAAFPPTPEIKAGTLSLTDFPVSPGDTINVIIDGTDHSVWNISILNHDKGWTFNIQVPYVVAGLTAEWIEELPTSTSSSTLANFDKVDFSNLKVNGGNPNLNSRGILIDMVSPSRRLARPSNSDGDSFSVCYGSDSCN